MRLHSVREFLRNHADRDNAVADADLETARHALYPALDYATPRYIIPERGPAPGLLAFMERDWTARALILAHLSRWIRQRRRRRQRLWAVFLYQHECLPESILALSHALMTISASL